MFFHEMSVLILAYGKCGECKSFENDSETKLKDTVSVSNFYRSLMDLGLHLHVEDLSVVCVFYRTTKWNIYLLDI